MNETRDRVERGQQKKAEKREDGKQNKVNETRDRVERGQQERQKKEKVGHERG